MIDFEYKSLVLQSDFYTLYRDVERSIYCELWDLDCMHKINDLETAFEWRSILFDSDPDMFRECVRISHSEFTRVARLRKRIQTLLTSHCIFVTLTFTDKTLESTSPDTRRQYVRRYLQQFGDYVGNIDFGGKKGREHYHAVVQADKISLKDWHHLGAIKVEHINNAPRDIRRLAKYVSKLTNHAIKETAKRNHIIYSRFRVIK